MSYRAFKRLLGETSLERKCRFLFGALILILITVSFWLYAWRTEHLAYDQLWTTCRLLFAQGVDREVTSVCRPVDAPPGEPRDPGQKKIAAAIQEFRNAWELNWPRENREYGYAVVVPDSKRAEARPTPEEAAHLRAFQENRELLEDGQIVRKGDPAGKEVREFFDYFGAVRATPACLGCHRQLNPGLAENDLLAMIRVRVPTASIGRAIHINRALLISFALATALVLMGFSYLIVRYVIVKPVKHLKEVSDAISAGELNVRSEIQTGDEFEDLSHAFNRMLRNLVSMQDRFKKANADLDRKVDELAQANLALYESNRLKSDFLATMSHELRTPLNSILGFSEVLLTSGGLSDKQVRWVTNIQSSGERLLNLINDILDLAKIEAGRMQVRVVEFNAYDVLDGMLTMFRPMAEKKGIDLRGQYAQGIPLLRQDQVKLQQILSNLLSNAIKFTPEGGRVTLRAEADGGHIVLTVSDTGVGIAPEEQERVFEKFRQAANPLTREHAGTGLGLSIVRELSKLLGGEVALQSELGRGSTFTVRLPLQRSEDTRLEFDLAAEGIDLSKAQRVDVRLYARPAPPRFEVRDVPPDEPPPEAPAASPAADAG